jgi:hypothetical protein
MEFASRLKLAVTYTTRRRLRARLDLATLLSGMPLAAAQQKPQTKTGTFHILLRERYFQWFDTISNWA